ncbi:MAG: tyrosine--tRNA ligase [Candidatus Saccharibacteria bacterium]|nr:tyrosine--tRNA ligase [Candidatus Saccharibacteria bacterium]
MSNMTLSEELKWRGFVNQTTIKDINILDGELITFYWGVDPSAASMTIGNLAAAMMTRLFIKHGHKAILLVGGATGMIGDPDGKSEERELKSLEEIAVNKAGISEQYSQIFAGMHFDVVDNYDWFKDMNYLTFLRDIGKHVPLRQMMSRDFVQSRLGESGAGISYAEFSYSLIQGYDFLHLHKEHGVSLQLCGADQWGNSIAGVDLIRRKTGNEAHVWSCPLIINKATGIKFGKSEDGAIWLDSKLTGIYKFYQFWLNSDDEGVEDYLKVYTTLSKDEIDDIMAQFNADKASRIAQKKLAYEVTKVVHGQARADSIVRVSESLFGDGDYQSLSSEDFDIIKAELKTVTAVAGETTIVSCDAKRFIDSQAVYLNGKKLSEGQNNLSQSDAINGFVIIRRGKNSQILVSL